MKRFIRVAWIIMVLAVFCLGCISAFAEPISGTIDGMDLEWVYEDGVFFVSGSGNVWGFFYESEVCDEATVAVLQENITMIPGDSFLQFSTLTDVWIEHNPAEEVDIDYSAFAEGVEIHFGTYTGSDIPVLPDNPDTEYTDSTGLWRYRRIGNGNCSVSAYLGTAENGTEVICPDHLEDQDDSTKTYHVVSFDDNVFRGMIFLTSVTLPDDTATLGKNLFYGCTGLKTVDLGKSAETLAQQTFYGCRALTDVSLPSTLKVIDSYAFGNCTVMTELSLPTGMTTIGNSVFYNCSNLVNLQISTTTVTIGNSAFSGCNSLTAISLPNSLTSLGTGVFTRCSALSSVTIGNGLDTIDGETFRGLPNLKTLTLNTNGTYIADGAFSDCTALQTVVISRATLGNSVFSGDTGLKSFRMTSGTIYGAPFGGCEMLETVTLGGGVTSLPYAAFSNLPQLKNITIQGALTSVPSEAFWNDTALTSIMLPSTVTSIETSAFYNCTGLTGIELPTALTEIGDYAFSYCTGLTAISLPSGVMRIGTEAFSWCSKLAGVHFADGARLATISDNTFSNCAELKNVSLPETVTTVGRNAFPTTTKVYCDPSSAAAKSISQNGGSFVSPDNEIFGIRWILDPADETLGLGLSIEQIWTAEKTITIPETIGSEMVTEIGKSALASCPTVENVTFPASVPEIPNALCKGNERLVSIVIPVGVTNIGAEAFADCSKLNSIQLPNTLTRIEERAFDGCTLLKTVTLSDNIREIGANAFSNTKVYANLGTDTAKMLSRTGGGFVCPQYPLLRLKYLFTGGEATSLEVIGAEETAVTIRIPESVTSIAAYAFADNKVLQNVTIGENVESIGAYAFSGSGVKAITLPEGVTVIPEYAFFNTPSLASFTAKGVITEIGNYAFSRSGISGISFADGLTRVGYYVFENAVGLVSCTLPDSVTEIGDYTFDGCRSLAAFTVPAGVKVIPYAAFRGTTQMETIQLPEGLESIGSEAFYQSGLASVTIPRSVKNIGGNAFNRCQGLKRVTMSGEMISIGSYAFEYCENLETVTMPDTLERMDYGAFYYCRKLKNIILPAGLNTIPSNAFSSCSALTHVKIGNGTVEIENGAFSNASALKSVELPGTLVRIGSQAFYDDHSLNAITIPNGVATIGEQAFYGCGTLSQVTMPDSIVSIGGQAFEYCHALTGLKLSGGLTSIPSYVFYSCTSLETVAIPDSTRSIGSYSFAQNTALTAVFIPESVTSIDETAFEYIEPGQLTIYCYENSAADSFAKAKGHSIVYMDGDNALDNIRVIPLTEAIYMSPGTVLSDLDEFFEIQPDSLPIELTKEFTTDNAAVAVIRDNTTMEGITNGDTTLKLTILPNQKATAGIAVHVRPALTNFTLENEIWQKRDEILELLPTSSVPEGVTDGYTWTIDHELGQIDGNILTPTAFGTGTLQAASWNGIKRTATIHIYEEPTEIGFTDVPAGMDIGMSTQLQPKVKAGIWFTGNEARHFITFSSSDETIVTVDAEGNVTATGYGTAVITATADNGCTGTANIHVSPEITGFNLQTNMRAPIGVTIDLAVTEVEPENANLNAFSWSVEPAGLAEYHNGKVTVLTDQECEVHITATSWNGISKTTDLYIYRPDVTSITIQDVNEWNWLPAYSDIQMTAFVEATNTFTNQLINWRVENDYGVSIDSNGILHTGYSGWVRVIAEADNGVKDEKEFYYTYPTDSFNIEKRYTIQTGETITIQPECDRDSRYRMQVGTPTLAKVDGMNITGLNPGRTELTVTSWNGIQRKAEVLVYDPIQEINITRIESLNGKASLSDSKHHIFATMNFRAHSAAISDRTYTDDLVTWTSSNPAVIRVTNAQTGEFRTVTFGEATLTATAVNGAMGSIDLHVYREVDSFKLPEKITAYVLADQELEVESYLPTDAFDGFVWSVSADIGTIEGQTLHVTADKPTTGTITCSSWDGFITHETELEIIQEPVMAVMLDPWADDTIDVGGVYPMTAHVIAGAEYINTFVIWSSSDETIATVDEEGRVTARSEGIVVITATAADNEDISDSITLEAAQGVDSFSVPETVTLYPDETYEIEITEIQPADAASRPFLYTSGDETIATVTNGVIRPKQWADGETTVTVASWNGVSREILVQVRNPQISGITVDGTGSLAVSEERQLTARVTADGEEFENRFIRWRSDNENVITIDANGVATAHAAGYAYIYATSVDWMLTSESIYIEVNEISWLSGDTKAETTIGGTVNLRCGVSGWSQNGNKISGENLTLGWASEDERIATVAEDGTVTGIGKGTTTITASYAPAGLSVGIPVTVMRTVTGFDLPGRITVAVGADAIALPALNIAPEEADASDLIWTVEPEGIVEIENGMIKALTDGDAEGTITASNIDGTVSKTARLTVYSPWVDRIELEPMAYLPYYQEAQIIAHVYAGDEEYENQLVTFKAYYDSYYIDENHEIQNSGYGWIDSKTGIIQATMNRCTYYIVVTAENGIQATMEVVCYPEYTDFTVTNPLLINVDNEGSGAIQILSYKTVGGYGSGDPYDFKYSTEDEDKIYVGDRYVSPIWNYDPDGYITGISTVMVTSVNGVSREVKVITYREDEIEKVDIAPLRINHPINETFSLNALVKIFGEELPGNPFVTWSSDTPKVISVNAAGLARTLSYGTATITATATNGKTASITLNVLHESSNFTLPELFETTYGQTITLDYARVEPEDAVMELSWTAEPAEYVFIEGNRLTPVINKDAEVTLTATNWDGTTRTTTLRIYRDQDYMMTMSLPAGLTEIEEEAFAGIAAEKVIIPELCTRIGSKAFAGSENLQVAVIPMSINEIAEDAFEETALKKIYTSNPYVIEWAERHEILTDEE